jgi:FAD/FMN-containing dehydrogenase
VGTVLGGLVLYPFDRAKEMLAFYRELTETAPDELTAYAALLTLPDGVRVAAIFACYAGPLSVGETVLRTVREFGPPLADLIKPIPYAAIQKTFDATAPAGLFNYWKSSFVRELSMESTDDMVAAFSSAPSPLTSVVVEHLGGAVGRVGEGDTAFSHRHARYSITAASLWRQASESEQNIAWTRRVWDAICTPADDAVYANYMTDDEGDQRVRAAYGANYARLVGVKNRYDPTNLFRVNQNIKPARERPAA